MIHTGHSSPWPGVLTNHAEGAWPAQINVGGQLGDPGYTTG